MADARPDRFSRVQRVFVAYGLGAVLMGAVNLLVFRALAAQYPGASTAYIRLCVSPLFAAVQEPLTSKLVPAVVVLVWTGRADQGAWLRDRWARVAAAGGLTVGVVELGSRVIDGAALDVGLVAPIALHVVTALLVGWAVYRTAGRRRSLVDLHLVLLAVGLAVLVHVAWNRYLWPVLAGPLPC